MRPFAKAIVRVPCADLYKGISTANLGRVDLELALRQHQAYVEALSQCGLQVIVLDAMEDFPDSTFVEDVAVVTHTMAVVTSPGAVSRRGEELSIKPVLEDLFTDVIMISGEARLEGGDVMMADDHFFIGLSERTNRSGAEALISIATEHGYTGSIVEFGEMLHLKTGVSYIGRNTLLMVEEMAGIPAFSKFQKVFVEKGEEYVANSLWINGTVLFPSGFPVTRDKLAALGFKLLELNVSEFRKLDGGLSCLSLRF